MSRVVIEHRITDYPNPIYKFASSIKYPEYKWDDISTEENHVYDMIRTMLYRYGLDVKNYGKASWNPFGAIIKKGDTVVIKPNWVEDKIVDATKMNTFYHTHGHHRYGINNVPYAVNITGLGTAFERQDFLRKMVTTMYRFALKKAKVVFFENSENMQLFIDERIIRKEQAKLLNGAGVNLDRFSLLTYPQDCDETRLLCPSVVA